MTANIPGIPIPAYQPRPVDLRLFLTTRFLSAFAVQFQSVAVGWQVYNITNDPVTLGYVGLFEFIPMMILALPAGDLADRVDRRFLLVITNLMQALASAFLVALSLTGTQQVWYYYCVITLFGIARGISTPALQSSLPFLVSKEELPRAVAWNSSAYTVANISGPALGGFLFAVGAALTYGLCLVLFAATAMTAFFLRMRSPAQMGLGKISAYQRMSEGVRFMWRRKMVLGAISLDLFAVLLGGAVALLPVYARDILHTGPMGLGILRSAPAVGAAAVAFGLAFRPLKRHTGAAMFAYVALFGLATIAFGLSTNFYLSLAALAVTGAADMVSVFVRSTLVQLATPDQMRGRVGAVNSLFVSASNELGQFESGITAGWFGTIPSVVIGGIGTLAITGIWMALFPSLRRIDRFSDVTTE